MTTDNISTSIATYDAQSICVRGYDLVEELIGRYTYTEILYFLINNRFPSEGEVKTLDACLVTLMEHGLTPSSLVARLVSDNVPDESQVAISAGLLTVGSVFVGTMEGTARLLFEGVRHHSDHLADYCKQVASEHKARKQPVPGFGHPHHKPDDPRPPRLFAVAYENGAKGDYIELVKRLGAAVDEVHGRHLTINATGAIAALLLEIGIPIEAMRGIAVASRAGGLIGHVMEERRHRSARRIWRLAEEAIPFSNPRTGSV